MLGIVGESGCGKSVTAMSLTGLNRTDPNARFSGSVRFRGRELLTLGERELRRVRGAEIAMVFQDPMTSLNPVHRVGSLIAETLRAHLQSSAGAPPTRVRSSCCARSASPSPSAARATTRTSSRAACASA